MRGSAVQNVEAHICMAKNFTLKSEIRWKKGTVQILIYNPLWNTLIDNFIITPSVGTREITYYSHCELKSAMTNWQFLFYKFTL